MAPVPDWLQVITRLQMLWPLTLLPWQQADNDSPSSSWGRRAPWRSLPVGRRLSPPPSPRSSGSWPTASPWSWCSAPGETRGLTESAGSQWGASVCFCVPVSVSLPCPDVYLALAAFLIFCNTRRSLSSTCTHTHMHIHGICEYMYCYLCVFPFSPVFLRTPGRCEDVTPGPLNFCNLNLVLQLKRNSAIFEVGLYDVNTKYISHSQYQSGQHQLKVDVQELGYTLLQMSTVASHLLKTKRSKNNVGLNVNNLEKK